MFYLVRVFVQSYVLSVVVQIEISMLLFSNQKNTSSRGVTNTPDYFRMTSFSARGCITLRLIRKPFVETGGTYEEDWQETWSVVLSYGPDYSLDYYGAEKITRFVLGKHADAHKFNVLTWNACKLVTITSCSCTITRECHHVMIYARLFNHTQEKASWQPQDMKPLSVS